MARKICVPNQNYFETDWSSPALSSARSFMSSFFLQSSEQDLCNLMQKFSIFREKKIRRVSSQFVPILAAARRPNSGRQADE